MPRSRALPLSLGRLVSGAVVLAALSARSQPPPGTASAAPTATASATASASATGAPVEQRHLRGADIPADKSDMPKDKKDWDAGKYVWPNREGGTSCVFRVLREWLRIECEGLVGGTLLAGDSKDVKIWSWGDPFAAPREDSAPPPGAQVPQVVIVMPLHRGESRLFDLLRMAWGYDSAGIGLAERISVMWIEGREDPIIVAQSPNGAWD